MNPSVYVETSVHPKNYWRLTMIDDPIVNEIRQISRAYAEQFNFDLHAICEDLRRQERASNREFRTPSQANVDRIVTQTANEKQAGI